MNHDQAFDFIEYDFALDRLPVALFGLQDVLTVPVDIDADVIPPRLRRSM
jgi:hypothetical protein